MNRHASGMSQSCERLAMDGQAGQSQGWRADGRIASSELRPTCSHELRYKTHFSSEVSGCSLLEWHLPEVMMNYLESDGRVASSELRPTCSHELRYKTHLSSEVSGYSLLEWDE